MREDVGLNQCGSCGGDKNWLNSTNILKVEPTRQSGELCIMHEEKELIMTLTPSIDLAKTEKAKF